MTEEAQAHAAPSEIRPRTAADTDGDVARVLGKLEARGSALAVARYVANSSAAFRPFILFSDALLSRAQLPADVREVVVLHLAVKRDNRYEWFEHEKMSQAAGITEEQRSAIRIGAYEGGLFSHGQRLAVGVADELIDRRQLSAGRWREAIDAWGPEGAMDLVLSIGWWGGLVPVLLEALGLEPPTP